jgi:uncharacterized protein YndB with AHSA1/START domain
MARILFETDVAAPSDAIVEALTTRDGIAAWWTDDVDFSGGEGTIMRLGFPVAPVPFELEVEETGPTRVAWRSVGTFPPHWEGTTVTWTLSASDGGQTKLHFSHDGWASDEGPFAMSAYTWGQLLGILKTYAETRTAAPLFTRK